MSSTPDTDRVMVLQEEDGSESGRLVEAEGAILADSLAEVVLAGVMRDNDLDRPGAFDVLWAQEWTNGPLRLVRNPEPEDPSGSGDG